MKRIVLFVLIFSLMSGFVFARRGVDPSFIPIDDEPLESSSGTIFKDPYLGMEFVYVPGGCYEMGCGSWTDRCDSDEKPVHTVCVDGFWIGKYEVTVGQWKRFVEETGYSGIRMNIWHCSGMSDPDNFSQGDNHPVVCVSWYDAKAFAKWLSEKTGLNFRLPTEAEWEYACRGGGKKVKYAGTSDTDELYRYANFCDSNCTESWKTTSQDDGYRYTAPVGSYKPNSLGLYDMSGNVWEWCEDVYSSDAYKHHSRRNPIYTSGGSYRIRGGSWNGGPRGVRCANRGDFSPGGRYNDVGFRLLLKK